MEQQNKKHFLINLLYYTVLSIIAFLSVKLLISYLLPIVIAVLVAQFSQNTALKLHNKTRLSLSLSSVFTVIIFFLGIIFCIAILMYGLFSFVRSVFGDFSAIGGMLKGFLENLRSVYSGFIHKISPEISVMIEGVAGDFISQIISSFTVVVSDFITSAVKSIPSFFFNCVIALVAGCYIAKDYDGWKEFIKGLCSKKFLDTSHNIAVVFKTNVTSVIKGYLKLWIITFAELLVGFLILRIRYALILAFVVSIVDLLPVLGTGTVLLPWALAELINDNGLIGYGLIAIYIFIIIVRNFAEPKIIGKQIGINPLFTLISMFLGLQLFGFWGLIILPVSLITVIKYYKAQMEEEGI